MRDCYIAAILFKIEPVLEATCYILEGKKVIPCKDIGVWQRFMDNLPERTVGSDKAGKFGVLTTFVGVNLGSEIMPKFFRTVISGDNGDNDPWLTETWEEAEAKHKAVVRAAIALTRSSKEREAGNVSGYKVVDCSILPDDELRFVLESEEAAIEMVSKPSQNWSREGRIVIFHPRRNKKSATDVAEGRR